MTKTLNVTVITRNDTAANWASKNPILSEGELGIETDTRKVKFGDGATAWNSLKYASGDNVHVATAAPTDSDTDYEVGTLWLDTANNHAYILFSTGTSAVWLGLLDSSGTIDAAKTADKLATARTFTIKGAVVENVQTFDGSADVVFSLVLADSGVTAGTYTKLTVNAQGIITGATTLSASDIPTLTLSKISDAGTAAAKDVGTEAGNVPVLGSDGKLDESVLPAIALTDTYTVSSEAEMLALDAQKGDVAIRTDVSATYILAGDDPSVAANWVVLKTPDCNVVSVNGKTGAITLTTSDIAEGTNLYYTEARATANFEENFAKKSVTELSDGDSVVLATDTIILNGGNA